MELKFSNSTPSCNNSVQGTLPRFGSLPASCGCSSSTSSSATNTTTIYPFVIGSYDFEEDGISYVNAAIINDQLSIFINEYTQQWLTEGAETFERTATGIRILIPGFDANEYDYTIMIQKLNS